MSTRYRLVIFDWEGTLGDTLGQIFHHIEVEAQHLQLGNFNHTLARQSVSLGFTNMLKKIFPKLEQNQYERLLKAINLALNSKPSDTFLTPGAKAFVSQLDREGIQLAIATNKGHQSLLRALHASGLEPFFKVTRSAGQIPSKPCPQMLEEILSEFKPIKPAETLMIGDSETDVEMAKNLRVDAIGMDFYHQQKSALLNAGALAVFDNYPDLAQYLQLPNSRESS